MAEFRSHIARRANAAGIDAADALVDQLANYLKWLARWNRKVNLTAFDLDQPTDHAIDRLIVEPLVAARHVRDSDRIAVDVGSGGGSPALPLRLAAPQLRMVLVEARARKAAFLREAARHLGLANVEVDTGRVGDDWRRPDLAGQVDLVSIRAVRPDDALVAAVEALAAANGRVFWFGEAAIFAARSGLLSWDVAASSQGPLVFTVFARRSWP